MASLSDMIEQRMRDYREFYGVQAESVRLDSGVAIAMRLEKERVEAEHPEWGEVSL